MYIESVLAEKIEKPEAAGAAGGVEITGHLGDVMKESAKIALTVSKNILSHLDSENKFFQKNRIHLHFPEVCFYLHEKINFEYWKRNYYYS